MPSGKVHDQLTVFTAAVAVPAWWLLSPSRDPAPLAITLGAYVFSGLWLSDDLDTKSVALRRWGPFAWLWLPYRKLVPHRSWLSHGFGVGPLLRVVYFLAMLWLVARGVLWGMARQGIPVDRDALLGSVWHNGLAWTFAHPTVTVWLVLGLVLGGVTHSAADAVVSFARRIW
ncbi:MAG: metal-binding protein [Capsulimonadaceae bacterium]